MKLHNLGEAIKVFDQGGRKSMALGFLALVLGGSLWLTQEIVKAPTPLWMQLLSLSGVSLVFLGALGCGLGQLLRRLCVGSLKN